MNRKTTLYQDVIQITLEQVVLLLVAVGYQTLQNHSPLPVYQTCIGQYKFQYLILVGKGLWWLLLIDL